MIRDWGKYNFLNESELVSYRIYSRVAKNRCCRVVGENKVPSSHQRLSNVKFIKIYRLPGIGLLYINVKNGLHDL